MTDNLAMVAELPETERVERCWQQVGEWIRTSYALVAPKKPARLVEP